MLPKILVAGAADLSDRQIILDHLSIPLSAAVTYEGSEAKVDDLRHWINFGVNVVTSTPNICLLVWDADKLSPECQAVLLKPLEETAEKVRLFLVVTNENSLLPTILSRCVIENIVEIKNSSDKNWKEAMACLVKGPSDAIALSEKLTKEEMEESLEELIKKLNEGLIKEVNKNRLKVLKKAIECLSFLRFTNVNAKLAYSNFLISSWRLIRA